MKKVLIIIISVVFALTCCTKEMARKPIAANNDGELSVLPMESNGSIGTRGYVESTEFQETTYEGLHATTKETVDRTMQISAYLYPQNGEQKNYFVDKTYAKGDDGLWHNTTSEGIDPIYWPVGGKLDFLAYSVSAKDSKNITAVWNSEDAANDITLKVPAENSQNDILFASAYGIESRSSAQAVAMKFNHAQAWIEFVLTGSTDDVNTDGIVTLKRIELENVYNAGTLAIDNNNGNATAKWDFSGEQRQNIEVDNCYGVAKLNETPQYLDMLIPQQTKTAFVLYYTLGSSAKELSYRFTTDQKTWLMGEKYVYNINITTNEVTVKPSVTEWGGPVNEFNYTLKVSSNNPAKGEVFVTDSTNVIREIKKNAEYDFNKGGGQATLTAIPKTGYLFKWSDGCTEAVRRINVTADAEYKAIFYRITAETLKYNPSRGTTLCEYTTINEATISATSVDGFEFCRWIRVDEKGNILGSSTRNPLSIVDAQEDSAYIAEFNLVDPYVSGKFSVSATKQVIFTKGNLWCDITMTPAIFSIESNQTAYPVSYDASHVGLFYYSKVPSFAYTKQYIDTSRAVTDVFFTNGAVDTSNSSFECDGKTGTFRTLSKEEWQYLVGDNEKRNGLFAYGVTVEGETNCIVLYPDGWTGDKVGNNGNLLSIPEGVVVLPSAGFFYEGHVNNVGDLGSYWSSTSSYLNFACTFSFNESGVYPGYDDNRNWGFSARLVSDIE